ncbi:MAG: hypothetical protein QHH30_10940 [candidate division NC10 bacterium]|nr:hypothetical protein [candidate division NC10 bacterium]
MKKCKKCGAPLDLVRPAAIILPCADCKASLEIRFSPEGHLLIEAAGASVSSLSGRPMEIQISQLDLFFHWEKVERSVAESLENALLGQCPLCKGNIYLEKGREVTVECEYCGGKTPLEGGSLMLRKKEEVLTFPASLLSLVKKMARPLNTEDKKQVILKYLRLYRWLLILLIATLLLLVIFVFKGLLFPD